MEEANTAPEETPKRKSALDSPAALVLLGPWMRLGAKVANGLKESCLAMALLARVLVRVPYILRNRELTLVQTISIGVSSLPLLVVTSIFTGAVATFQCAYQFRNFVPDKFIGTAACKMILIELGPVLTGLVLAGRVGSALAAEIGSMKEKEELDAMEALNLDSLRYLALPRFAAFIVMMPALTLISDLLALFGGWLVAVLSLNMTTYTYTSGLQLYFQTKDLCSGMLKSFIFGVIICLMGYVSGRNAGAGARGVGLAVMRSVVSACVLILIFDFVVALCFF